MTIIELKDQIMKRTLSNFYVFVGSEIGIMNIYLNKMAEVSGVPLIRANSVASICSECTTRSMFGNKASLYVIREDREFAKNEEAFQSVPNDILKGNIIVLLYEKVDSRLKFGKFFKDCTIQFDKLTPSVLKSYIAKEIHLSSKNIETLISVCGGSYDVCMLEIDKIRRYSKSGLEDEAFEDLLNCGVIYQSREYDVFQFTDAVCSRNARNSFDILETLLDNGESSVAILGTLYNSLKAVLLIQCCEDKDIAGVTGLDNRVIYFSKKYVGKYKPAELVAAVKLIIKVVDGIKNGWIDDAYATKYVLVNIL